MCVIGTLDALAYTRSSSAEFYHPILDLYSSEILHLLQSAFLPQGYPESVSKDYLEYQVWDTVQVSYSTVLSSLLGILDLPYLKVGIWILKQKWGQDMSLKVCTACGMLKRAIRIMRLSKSLSQDDGIEEPHWGPTMIEQLPAKCRG